MADQRSSLPIYSIAESKPVSVSADTNANATGNPIYVQPTDGTNDLDYVVVDSAFGATPVALPIAGKYEATPTTYADGDATPLLVDENGRLQVDVVSLSGGASEHVEDTAHTTGDTGSFSLSVRLDARASTADTSGDYAGFVTNANGELYVIDTDSLAKLTEIDTELDAQGLTLDNIETSIDNIEADVDALTKAEDAAHVSGDSGVQSLAVRKDAVGGAISTNSSADGDYSSVLQDGNGSLYVTVADSSGNLNSETSPMFVQVVDGALSGIEVIDYDTASAIAVDAVSNHDYTVTATKTIKIKRAFGSASGAQKIELLAGPVAGLVSYAVAFTSTANPNWEFNFDGLLEIPDTSTGTVRIARTNFDDAAMDLYSTIVGTEV